MEPWDPIGVCPNTGGPIDEYDSYLDEILRLLEAGASEQEMADYLVWVVGEHMGLGALSIARAQPRERWQNVHRVV